MHLEPLEKVERRGVGFVERVENGEGGVVERVIRDPFPKLRADEPRNRIGDTEPREVRAKSRECPKNVRFAHRIAARRSHDCDVRLHEGLEVTGAARMNVTDAGGKESQDALLARQDLDNAILLSDRRAVKDQRAKVPKPVRPGRLRHTNGTVPFWTLVAHDSPFDVPRSHSRMSLSMTHGNIRLGVIGCGRFARFALPRFTHVPNVTVTNVTDSSESAARDVARQYGATVRPSVDALVAQPDVDLVYIATPPVCHHPEALAALTAGKHVLCEKPLALTLENADAMIAAATAHHRLLAIDFLQAYNPLLDRVRTLIAASILGQPLRAYFENYASDADLPPEHWFWDSTQSGGIFVEHGVHFFDLFRRLFGEGTVRSAERAVRPSTGAAEHVQCAMQYGETMIAHMYHGFHQPKPLDRQELRIVFEHGDVALSEWIPTRIQIRALVSEAAEHALADLFPGASLRRHPVSSEEFPFSGRGTSTRASRIVTIKYSEGEKDAVYGTALSTLLIDQLAAMRDGRHSPRVTAADGRAALALALEATRRANS